MIDIKSLFIKKNIYTIASGYFSLGIGPHHLDYLASAKYLVPNNILIVILNNDIQIKNKGSITPYTFAERIKMLYAIKYVDIVVPSIDKDNSVSETIRSLIKYRPRYFCNGGAEYQKIQDVAEYTICNQLGIEIINNVGGQEKTNSSSWIAEKIAKDWIRKKLEL